MKCESRPDKAASGEGKKNELDVPEKIGRMKTGKAAVSHRAPWKRAANSKQTIKQTLSCKKKSLIFFLLNY